MSGLDLIAPAQVGTLRVTFGIRSCVRQDLRQGALLNYQTSPDRSCSRRVKPFAKPQESRKSLIDGNHLLRLKHAKDAPHPPLVDRAQVVNQCEGLLRQAACAGREGRIQQTLARRPCDRHNAHERKVLVADDVRIADHDAGPYPVLLVAECRVDFDHDNRPATQLHLRPSAQPSPGTH